MCDLHVFYFIKNVYSPLLANPKGYSGIKTVPKKGFRVSFKDYDVPKNIRLESLKALKKRTPEQACIVQKYINYPAQVNLVRISPINIIINVYFIFFRIVVFILLAYPVLCKR